MGKGKLKWNKAITREGCSFESAHPRRPPTPFHWHLMGGENVFFLRVNNKTDFIVLQGVPPFSIWNCDTVMPRLKTHLCSSTHHNCSYVKIINRQFCSMFLILLIIFVCVQVCDFFASELDYVQSNRTKYQCFSTGGPRPTGGPQRSLSGPPNFNHFVLNRNFIHYYYKFYKRNDKISQFYLHKMHEKGRKKFREVMVGPKMFTFIFSGPPCFSRWEPLY